MPCHLPGSATTGCNLSLHPGPASLHPLASGVPTSGTVSWLCPRRLVHPCLTLAPDHDPNSEGLGSSDLLPFLCFTQTRSTRASRSHVEPLRGGLKRQQRALGLDEPHLLRAVCCWEMPLALQASAPPFMKELITPPVSRRFYQDYVRQCLEALRRDSGAPIRLTATTRRASRDGSGQLQARDSSVSRRSSSCRESLGKG